MFLMVDKYLKDVYLDEFSAYEINENNDLPYMMRLKHKCENCGSGPELSLFGMQYQISLFFIPIARHFKEYYVKCKKCHVRLLIDYEEYRSLKKIAKMRE
ncbi:zinc-ribbon domain-containing protein [Acidaminobacter sp. JC074]|uniref:zinc-ribbon domain-containing protein n=1 Tax=Acidaminobacter sp. JC074 TaxID=2530199 RepID=UPI001F0D0CC4|nr:zinc-ribbon domain-containing protein [Acidaminobacter sp. JC074]MCH4886244.1 zinc-ribbon domain-containing protein [Acidaminobacter sp. JC074]